MFSSNYTGYQSAAEIQNFNLQAINEYHNSSNKTVLELKSIHPELFPFGYNLGNWNEMPYFMKQCYKINEDTVINYIN